MRDIELIKEMLLMQQKLNDDTNSKGWEEGYNSLGKLINWKRCIYMECAELIDNFAWKHWKDVKKPTDYENVRIELVDIWHFILSYALEQAYSKDIDIETLSKEIACSHGFVKFCNEPFSPKEHSMYEVINDIEVIIHGCSGSKFELNDLLTAFFRVAWKCGMSFDNLYKIYIGKNILNKFRQDHGYKEGSYKKMWNGKEDNEILAKFLDSDKISSGDLYKKLEEFYKTLG